MPLNMLFQVSDTTGVFDSGSGSYNADDAAFRTWAEGLGHTVVPFLHSDSVPSDMSPYNIVIFGHSMQSNTASKWNTINIPVLSLQLGRFLHTQQASVTFASNGDTRTTVWVNPLNTIDAAPTGVLTAYTSTPTTGYAWFQDTNLASTVIKYAAHQENGTRITGIAIEGGATLLNGAVCPSRRATLPIREFAKSSNSIKSLTITLLDWLVVAPTGDTTPPSTIANLAATVNTSTVSLTWTASTDNVAVTGYEIHRSSTTGFTPTGATLRGTVTTNAYSDTGLSADTYYYRVVVIDGAGNKSAASNTAQAVVSASAPASPRYYWDATASEWKQTKREAWNGTVWS